MLTQSTITRDQLGAIYSADRPDTDRVVLEFVETRGDELLAKIPVDFRGAAAQTTCEAALRDRVVAQLRTRFAPLPDFGEAAITRAIEGMDACITARAALEPQLHAYLARVK